MAAGDIETRKVNGRWVNIVQGSHDTQDAAEVAGADIARQLDVEHFARSSRTGRWFRRSTYGTDPRRSKG